KQVGANSNLGTPFRVAFEEYLAIVLKVTGVDVVKEPRTRLDRVEQKGPMVFNRAKETRDSHTQSVRAIVGRDVNACNVFNGDRAEQVNKASPENRPVVLVLYDYVTQLHRGLVAFAPGVINH